jgi:hypothetical protein
LPDVYFVSQTGRDRLFRNLGGLRFEDASDRAGLGDESDWGAGAAFADVDGDGDLDLYVCNPTRRIACGGIAATGRSGAAAEGRSRIPRRERHGFLRRLRP